MHPSSRPLPFAAPGVGNNRGIRSSASPPGKTKQSTVAPIGSRHPSKTASGNGNQPFSWQTKEANLAKAAATPLPTFATWGSTSASKPSNAPMVERQNQVAHPSQSSALFMTQNSLTVRQSPSRSDVRRNSIGIDSTPGRASPAGRVVPAEPQNNSQGPSRPSGVSTAKSAAEQADVRAVPVMGASSSRLAPTQSMSLASPAPFSREGTATAAPFSREATAAATPTPTRFAPRDGAITPHNFSFPKASQQNSLASPTLHRGRVATSSTLIVQQPPGGASPLRQTTVRKSDTPTVRKSDAPIVQPVTAMAQQSSHSASQSLPARDSDQFGTAKTRAELFDSLSEEAVLEATIARKRSLAMMQASWINTLKRRTETLRRHAHEGKNMLSDPVRKCAQTQQQRNNDFGDMSSLPDSAGAEALRDAMAEGYVEVEHGEAGLDQDEDEDGAAWSLEAAKEQLVGLRELRRQVACLEEEHAAREAEVAGLGQQLRSLSRNDHYPLATAHVPVAEVI